MTFHLGVHIGSEYTSLAIKTAADAPSEVIANEDGDRFIPTYIELNENGQVELCGTPAKYRVIRAPTGVSRGVRDLNNDADHHALQAYMEWVKKTAEGYTGDKIASTCITLNDASFDQAKLRAFEDICKKIDMNLVSCIDERIAVWLGALSTAPSPSMMLAMAGEDHSVVVIDVGARATRVSVLNIRSMNPCVAATVTNTEISGLKVDSLLGDYFRQEFQRKYRMDLREEPRAMRKLLKGCEDTKKTLSSSQNAFLAVESLYDGLDFNCVIHRGRFEAMIQPLASQLTQLIQKCLQDAGVLELEFSGDDIFVVGGMSRIPLFRSAIQTALSNYNPAINVDPQEIFSLGAVMEAAMSEEQQNEELCAPIQAVSVCQYGLGLLDADDQLVKLFDIGHPLPAKRTFQLPEDQPSAVLKFVRLESADSFVVLREVSVSDIDSTTSVFMTVSLNKDHSVILTFHDTTKHHLHQITL